MLHLTRLGRATGHGDNGLTIVMKDGERLRLRISVSRIPPDSNANP